MKKKKLLLPFLFIFSTVIIFFYPFFIQGKLPIPADTIVGLYYPFRDLYSQTNPNGLPYKNFLVTDPVRQQYPWKNLAVSLQKQLQIPLWNPYEMAGTPLLANFQSSAYYPLNLLLYIFPFSIRRLKTGIFASATAFPRPAGAIPNPSIMQRITGLWRIMPSSLADLDKSSKILYIQAFCMDASLASL
jgi:hypothetical protein